MKTAPAFLLMLAVLAALLGCQGTTPPAEPKMAVAASAPKPKTKDPPPELYNREDFSALEAYVRGEPVVITPEPGASGARQNIEMMCVASGDFNVAADGETLFLETWCATRNPTTSVVVVQVEDVQVARVPNKHIFRVPFMDTVVSVQNLDGGGREVRLHYLDSTGTFHHITLQPQRGKKYSHSFADLSPDTVQPIGQVRMMEIGSE